MKNKLFALAWSAALILAAWIAAGPFVAAYQIRTAVQQRDAQALGDHVDFPAVRDSLNDQVATLFGSGSSDGTQDSGGGFANFARVLVGSALQVMVTPQGVLELLRRRTALADGAPQAGGDSPGSAPSTSDGAPKLKPVIHYAFASINRFNVAVAEAEHPEVPVTLVLRRYGLEWKLAAIEFPTSAH